MIGPNDGIVMIFFRIVQQHKGINTNIFFAEAIQKCSFGLVFYKYLDRQPYDVRRDVTFGLAAPCLVEGQSLAVRSERFPVLPAGYTQFVWREPARIRIVVDGQRSTRLLRQIFSNKITLFTFAFKCIRNPPFLYHLRKDMQHRCKGTLAYARINGNGCILAHRVLN